MVDTNPSNASHLIKHSALTAKRQQFKRVLHSLAIGERLDTRINSDYVHGYMVWTTNMELNGYVDMVDCIVKQRYVKDPSMH